MHIVQQQELLFLLCDPFTWCVERTGRYTFQSAAVYSAHLDQRWWCAAMMVTATNHRNSIQTLHASIIDDDIFITGWMYLIFVSVQSADAANLKPWNNKKMFAAARTYSSLSLMTYTLKLAAMCNSHGTYKKIILYIIRARIRINSESIPEVPLQQSRFFEHMLKRDIKDTSCYVYFPKFYA